MQETWVDIPGYETLYRASSFGRIKGVKRGKVLSPALNPRGYFFVNLSKEGKVRVHKVHSLVALAFYGTRPEGHQVRHLDSDKTNNHKDNLAYGTLYQNCMDAYLAGTYLHKPVTQRMKARIRILVAQGYLQKEVAEMCDVSKSTVSRVVRNGRRLAPAFCN